MTDTLTITDATAATFREQMTARGIPADQIDATLAKAGYGGGQQQAPPPAAPQSGNNLDHAKLPRLSDTELEAAADNLSRFWTGDPAVLENALRRAGLELVDEADDPRTDTERQFDATLGAPASSDDYALPDLWVNRTEMPMEDRAHITGAVRTAMGEMGVPKPLGAAVASYMLDGVMRWADVQGNPAAVAQYHAAQKALVCRVLNTNWETVTAAVKPILAKLSADSKTILAEHGALEYGPLLVHLYRTAEMGAFRRGLEKSR